MVITARLALACTKESCERICGTDEQIISENIFGHDSKLLISERLAINTHRRRLSKHSRSFRSMAVSKQSAESEET
jgi:hypothetical protein